MTARSLRAAIDAKCRACGYSEGETGTWRQQVTACPVTDCPLWRVRPLVINPPGWLASRDPATLPTGWRSLRLHDLFAGPGGIRPGNASRLPFPGQSGAVTREAA